MAEHGDQSRESDSAAPPSRSGLEVCQAAVCAVCQGEQARGDLSEDAPVPVSISILKCPIRDLLDLYLSFPADLDHRKLGIGCSLN